MNNPANKFQALLDGGNTGRPVIWLMRQAGRYHAHYQNIKKTHTFLEMCRDPLLAAEVAMGPMDDFNFDAAILFSDILFPFEAMNCPVDFNPSPSFPFLLKSVADIKKYTSNDNAHFFTFQQKALKETRARLSADKGLLGFIGGPFTLYSFAVEGTAKNDPSDTLKGLKDGRFAAFIDTFASVILENYKTQAEASPDCMAVFDSGTRILSDEDFSEIYFPVLQKLFSQFKQAYPTIPILYYAKGLSSASLDKVMQLPITVLGIDDETDIIEIAKRKPKDLILQGNIPPEWTTLEPNEFKTKVDAYLEKIAPYLDTTKWICSLGHGVVPTSREENIRYLVEKVRTWPTS